MQLGLVSLGPPDDGGPGFLFQPQEQLHCTGPAHAVHQHHEDLAVGVTREQGFHQLADHRVDGQDLGRRSRSVDPLAEALGERMVVLLTASVCGLQDRVNRPIQRLAKGQWPAQALPAPVHESTFARVLARQVDGGLVGSSRHSLPGSGLAVDQIARQPQRHATGLPLALAADQGVLPVVLDLSCGRHEAGVAPDHGLRNQIVDRRC